MFEVTKNNLHIFVQPTSLVGDCAVSLCLKVKMNPCCLNKLKGACNCMCFPAGSEEASICYALYLVVQHTLCGDPLATVKSKVGAVDCGVHNGTFSITWKVKGTISALRKSIGLALKQFCPSKLYPTYAQCVKAANGKPNKDSFLYVANMLTKSINESVNCGIVGNVKLADDSKLKEMAEVLIKKIAPDSVAGAKSAPTDHTPCDHSDKTELKVNGWASYVVKDYIQSKVKGLSVVVCDNYILLGIKQAQWDTLSKRLKKNVSDYVAAKYTKLGDNLAPIMAYIMISNATVCCTCIAAILKSAPSQADIVKAITNAL